MIQPTSALRYSEQKKLDTVIGYFGQEGVGKLRVGASFKGLWIGSYAADDCDGIAYVYQNSLWCVVDVQAFGAGGARVSKFTRPELSLVGLKHVSNELEFDQRRRRGSTELVDQQGNDAEKIYWSCFRPKHVEVLARLYRLVENLDLTQRKLVWARFVNAFNKIYMHWMSKTHYVALPSPEMLEASRKVFQGFDVDTDEALKVAFFYPCVMVCDLNTQAGDFSQYQVASIVHAALFESPNADLIVRKSIMDSESLGFSESLERYEALTGTPSLVLSYQDAP